MHSQMMQSVLDFKTALLYSDRISAEEILWRYKGDMPPGDLLDTLIVPSLEQIGAGWENGDIALSQVYISGRICEELVDRILPPADPVRKRQPKTAIAVLEDYHLLGKRIVYSCLRAGGYELLDFGRMDAGALSERVIQEEIEILLISVLMLRSALRVSELRKQLAGARIIPKIVVGGAPFRLDRQLWQEVGADAYGYNASEAVSIVNNLAREMANHD